MRSLVSPWVGVLIAVLECSACKGAEQGTPSSDTDAPRSRRPLPTAKMIPNRDVRLPDRGVRVELPDPPAPEKFESAVPLTYEDGAYSIRGLREDFDARIAAGEGGADVDVRAWVQEVYLPPPGCNSGPHCKPPHLFVTDEPDTHGRRRAMLIGSHVLPLEPHEAALWADEPDVLLERGNQYLFKGKFLRSSDGLDDARGLLQFTAYRGESGEWIYAKGSPSHPKVIEQDAAMHERLMQQAGR